ncbi:MAG TPA: oxygen-independent coproporphyrinogen III oxidase [Casimicrobiaceae bacterium]|nr:oxygen-independent coproporphyrinogen III oxidase [Casimicrobiaceae bacterium]
MNPALAPAPSEQVALAFDSRLVRKYDGHGPRYTSYPTADRFDTGFGAADYVAAIQTRNACSASRPLSLYVHLPFCNTICYYCACNKIVTRNRAHAARYLDHLEREIAQVASLVEGEPRVTQLHWGGGTPTFLAHDEMRRLMEALRRPFAFDHDAEISIEVDPRKVEHGTVAFLADLGFNRMSIGVQDFDPVVQIAVNRVQSEAQTRSVIDEARAARFGSINIDLIYGLPRQTVAGFATTLDKVIAAAPDRIALYSYAHVPQLFKSQRRIAAADLPAPEAKLDILAHAIARLTAAGYVYIGMDHFARPDDELAVAQREHRLHRNFQGYSTRAECDLLGFGVSAIGKVGDAYVQNVKTLDAYYERVAASALPVLRGRTLDREDLLRRDVIQRLMCDFALRFADVERAHAVRFAEHFEAELAALRSLADDGIVEIDRDSLVVTPVGRLLVRVVAMVFDAYLPEHRQAPRYSRVV